jgi:predicted enzyme related to lactoylglutathione lyase
MSSLPSGSPSHLELGSPDAAASREFFVGLFGWADRPMPHGSFYATTPTLGVGLHGHDDTSAIVVYFAVDDIDRAVEQVRALGGTSDDPGPEIAGFGRFAECRDPQGVRFGLHQRR